MNTARKLDLDHKIFDNLETKFFVDVGASCDYDESQTEFLLKRGWQGIFLEYNDYKSSVLSERVKNFSCSVINTKVTPENIIEILEKFKVPNNFFLSLDIDSYDFYVLEKILSKFQPQLIISEINEKIPPPIKFSVLYDESIHWDGTHFYGYSLAMLEDLLTKNNYKIKLLDYNNVVLIPGIQDECLDLLYSRGYYLKPDRKERFYYNQDFEKIFYLQENEQIKFINDYFIKHKNKFYLRGSND